jgi:hypothetical protein
MLGELMVWVGMSQGRFVGGRNVKVPDDLHFSPVMIPHSQTGARVIFTDLMDYPNLLSDMIPTVVIKYPTLSALDDHLIFS